MRLSLPVRYLIGRYGYQRAFDLVKHAGFDAVDHSMEDMVRDDSILLGDNWREYVEDVKKYADSIGLDVNQTHAPFSFSGKLWKDKDGFENVILPRIIRSLEISGILGAQVAVVHPLHHYVYEGHADEIFERNMEYYRMLIPYAKEYGIKIGVENMWQVDARRKYIVHDTCSHISEFIRYIDTLDSEYIVACLDIGHVGLIQQQDEAWDFIRALGHGRLRALHVHDNNYREDTHSLPYVGKIDWQRITEALGEIDYAGDFTYETIGSLARVDDEFVPCELSHMVDVGRHLMDLIDRRRDKAD